MKHSVVNSESLDILLWTEYYSNDHLSYGGGISVKILVNLEIFDRLLSILEEYLNNFIIVGGEQSS